MAKKTSKASANRTSSSKKTTKKKLSKKKTAKKSTKASSSTPKRTVTQAAADKPTNNGKKTISKKKTGKKTTAGKTTKKPTRTRKPKTPFGKRELTRYRNILMIKRAEIRGDMDSMQAEALLNHDSANLSHMPIHMADVGSDQYDQELTLGLVESERRLLNEIEEALHRIQEGTYGICEVTGEPINKARLDAKPWAKYTIEVAREMERNGSSRY